LDKKNEVKMIVRKFGSFLCALFLTLTSLAVPTHAAAYQPDGYKFKYGANLDLDGSTIKEAMELANQLDLDWVAVFFDWQDIWPDQKVNPDLSNFIRAVTAAQQKNISVLLTIANPPNWALTPQGPDHQLTIHLVSTLVKAFPNTIKAVELFPGANIYHEWGAAPDASNYLSLIREVMAKLQGSGQDTIVLPSLTETRLQNNTNDQDVVQFLHALYQAGGKNWMPIIALRFPSVNGSPLDDPNQLEAVSLRDYERIRQEMIKNDHENGTIWITGFSWPTSVTAISDQVDWLRKAYQLLKAQLYIGAAFFSWFNKPGFHDQELGSASLISENAEQHPACIVYIQLRPDTAVTVELPNGKPFIKMMPKTLIKKTSP
jgi:hypothetical protein